MSNLPEPSSIRPFAAGSRTVAILGSTGSIGVQALDVIDQAPERFSVLALSAGGSQLELLARQAARFEVQAIGVADADRGEFEEHLERFAKAYGREGWRPELYYGPEANLRIAELNVDVVLNGISGSIGLRPTLAALESGSVLALANKESLVVGGPLVKARAGEGQIVPVDSEHSAIAQALRAGSPGEVDRLILTASGGPFRGYSRERLVSVTPEEALNHPTWDMGPVVTTNSATLVNKGLEIIEAHLLFDIPFDRIDAVVHPQSIVHSMVQFNDGSTVAQCSPPDMRLPIALGLNWPDRVAGAALACDWTKASQWSFEPLDEDVFSSVRLARQAGESGSTYPAVYNAANEEAVEAFLAGTIKFLAIVETIEAVLQDHRPEQFTAGAEPDIESVLGAEGWARAEARNRLGLGNRGVVRP